MLQQGLQRSYSPGSTWKLGDEFAISISLAVISTGISAKSGVLR
jgi:hypothetical protein